MYKIVLVSWGGTRRDFMCGFATEEEAIELCEQYGWQYQQEKGGYIWDLEIEEDEDYQPFEEDPEYAAREQADAQAAYDYAYGIDRYEYPEDEPFWMR